MKVTMTKENTHIEDSYQIKLRKSMENEIDYIKELRKVRRYPVTRTTNSYIREWRAHNRLYRWGILKERTKSVDLNEKNTIWEELLWIILGL